MKDNGVVTRISKNLDDFNRRVSKKMKDMNYQVSKVEITRLIPSVMNDDEFIIQIEKNPHFRGRIIRRSK